MAEEERLKEINRSDLESLPNSYDCKERFEIVRQAAATIIDPQKTPLTALYTFFATSCLILMISAKNSRGEIIRIGMTHIDNTVTLNGIRKFFDQFNTEIENASIEALY